MADEHQKWLDRGFFLLDHGRYEQAEVELRRALAGEVDRSYGFYLLAWGQAKLGKLAEAEENARRSLAENPASARGYEVLTMVFDQRGQLAQAEKAARSALEREPQSAAYRADLAWIMRRHGRPSEALAVLDEALRNEPLMVRLHISRTGALIELRRWEDATESALHTLSLHPLESVSRRQLGDIAFEQKDYAGAETHYAQALRLDPKDVHARARLLKAMRHGFWYYRVLLPGKPAGDRSTAILMWPFWVAVAIARVLPAVAVCVFGLLLLIALFLTARWFLRKTVAPVTTFRLRYHPLGRAVLTPDEIECSEYVAMLIGGAVLAFGAALLGAWGLRRVLFSVGILFLILSVPVTWTYEATGRQRTVREAYTWLLFSVGALGIAAMVGRAF